MKRKLLPLVIGAAIAMPSAALAGPKVYGKVNVTLEMLDHDKEGKAGDYDKWEVNSNASRLGFKGDEKINNDLKAIYKLEYQVDVDNGDSVFSQRNIFGGFKGGFGEIIVGKFDTPTKKAQNKIDVFGDYKSGDIKNVIKYGENRIGNSLQYTSPNLGGVKAKLDLIQGEATCATDANGKSPKECDNGIADGISASVAYDQEGIYAAIAMDKDVKNMDILRLVGQFNLDQFQVGILYQSAENSDAVVDGGTSVSAEQTGFILSAAMKMGDGKVKAQFGSSEVEATSTDLVTGKKTTGKAVETSQFGIGYEHKMSKQTMVFAHYIMLEQDKSFDQTSLAFGMQHKF